MNLMRATKSFEDEDGKFAVDDEFEVNDERAFVLERTGRAVRATSPRLPRPDTSGGTVATAFGVPRQAGSPK